MGQEHSFFLSASTKEEFSGKTVDGGAIAGGVVAMIAVLLLAAGLVKRQQQIRRLGRMVYRRPAEQVKNILYTRSNTNFKKR